MAVLMESPWYQEILREGEKRGELRGEERAKRETLQKGILAGLDIRFGPVPARIAERIRGIADPERLDALHSLTYTSGSLDEFERALQDG